MLLYKILACTIHEEMKKSQTPAIDLRYELQRGTENVTYLMNCILYQIFKTILNAFSKNIDKRLIIL